MNPGAPWLSPTQLELVGSILRAHQLIWQRPLWAGLSAASPRQAAQELFAAAPVLLAHDGGADPKLIYANAAALKLWRRCWGEMVGMPSRLTAEPRERAERAGALTQARLAGGLDGYGGVRIDSQGRRFRIQGARLWTLVNDRQEPLGQAAWFASWWWL